MVITCTSLVFCAQIYKKQKKAFGERYYLTKGRLCHSLTCLSTRQESCTTNLSAGKNALARDNVSSRVEYGLKHTSTSQQYA